MVNLYKRKRFELRPPMGRTDKTKEENVKFWLEIKKRLKSGDPVSGDPRRFGFGVGFSTLESKIKYCNDMIYFINYGIKKPVIKNKKVKNEGV